MLDPRESILRAKLAVTTGGRARLGLLASLAFRRFARLYRKFDPDQPRDEMGRWTGTGVGTREDYASLRDDEDISTGSVVTVQRDRTGDPYVDAHSDVFEQKLKEAMEKVGPGAGPAFGLRVHFEFTETVRNLGLPGVTVEKGFQNGESAGGYSLGDVRTDVVLHSQPDGSGSAIAIWDLTTGSATLTQARVDQLRREVQGGANAYVIELHALNGTTTKSTLYGKPICPTP